MAAKMLPTFSMESEEDALQDVVTRTRQLEAHILRSPDYLFRAGRSLKRQMVVLCLAIVLLFIFEGLFIALEAHNLPPWLLALICATSVLVTVNCVLLIRTKQYLHRLNESWLNLEERNALATLREQHARIRSQAHDSVPN